MKIAGLQKNSTIDYPGKLSSVVFVAGCNYDCYYCHNRHLLQAEEKVLKEELFQFLEKRKGLIDGIVITGGEPTLYSNLPSFVKEIKKMGYSIKLDTNGSNSKMVEDLVSNDLVDYIAIDYKAPFNKYNIINATDHIKENENQIISSINCVMKQSTKENTNFDYEIRTTMIPEITVEDIINMAKSFPTFNKYVLQKYRPVPEDPGVNENRKYYQKEDLENIQESIKKYQPNTIIRA